jgi:biopolymer transport protein ExbB/TolQ
MDQLTHILLPLCNVLLVPVIGALFLLLAMSLLHCGGFMVEGLARWRHRRRMTQQLGGLRRGDIDLETVTSRLTGLPFIDIGLARLRETTAYADKALDDLQLAAERNLSRLQLAVRLGPMLGLAGTLIPLGPALQALSQGQFDTLAQRLIVAFSTTVIGLFVGGICFLLHTCRQSWYTQDLSDLAFIYEIAKEGTCAKQPSAD